VTDAKEMREICLKEDKERRGRSVTDVKEAERKRTRRGEEEE
jgi:hypothetical protein